MSKNESKEKIKKRASRLEIKQRIELTVSLICRGYGQRDAAYAEFVKKYPDCKKSTFFHQDWRKAQKRLIKLSEQEELKEIAKYAARQEFLYRDLIKPENNENITEETYLKSESLEDIPLCIKQITAANNLISSQIKLKGLNGAKKVEVVESGNKNIPFEYWAEVNRKAREAKKAENGS